MDEITILAIALYAFLMLYVLWIFYLAVMNLKRARDANAITRTALCFGYPVLIVGYALDVFVNLTLMSVFFLELPHETTMTSRVKRHLYHSQGWREKLAAWFCHNLLNSFDPSGKHC